MFICAEFDLLSSFDNRFLFNIQTDSKKSLLKRMADDFTIDYDECMSVAGVYFIDFVFRNFRFKYLFRIFIVFVIERI